MFQDKDVEEIEKVLNYDFENICDWFVENNLTLREKCPNTEFFLVHIFHIQSECREIRTRRNSVYGHFSRSVGIYISQDKTKSILFIS